MKNGYVYILTNQSMPDLIKIGKTARESRERARELSSTSVPTPFKVAFEVFSNDFDCLEKAAHERLNDFRVASNREFFRYPLDKAITLLQELNSPSQYNDSNFEAADITNLLIQKYPDHLNEDIVSVRIVQPGDRVWLEITTKQTNGVYLIDQTIKRSDLGFIVEEYEGHFFQPDDLVQVNVQKFVEELDPFSIMMTTDLFKESVCDEINKK